MARHRLMLQFARWHIWLGWLVGLPILMWTATGLFMVARPIEEVRGDRLRAPQAAIVTAADGARWRYSARTGAALPPVVRREAQTIAAAAYAGDSRLEAVTYFPAGEAPREARTGAAAWRARFADGTHVYIDDATGE